MHRCLFAFLDFCLPRMGCAIMPTYFVDVFFSNYLVFFMIYLFSSSLSFFIFQFFHVIFSAYYFAYFIGKNM